MARFYIDKVSCDSEYTYYFIKPSETSYADLRNDRNKISIYRLFVLPKNEKYIDIYDNQVE